MGWTLCEFMEYKANHCDFFAISTCILLGTNWVLTGYITINILQLVLFDNSFDTLSHQIWRTWWFKWAPRFETAQAKPCTEIIFSWFFLMISDDSCFFYRNCDFFGWFWIAMKSEFSIIAGCIHQARCLSWYPEIPLETRTQNGEGLVSIRIKVASTENLQAWAEARLRILESLFIGVSTCS